MAACGQLGNVLLRRELNRRRLDQADAAEEGAAETAADAAVATGLLPAATVERARDESRAAARLCGRSDLDW
jgi:hypothetical protein